MLIVINRKRVEAGELFPTLQSFIEELKISYNNLNFVINIQIKILDVYNKILIDDGVVRHIRFSRWFPSAFNFKFKNRNQLGFWLERGFSEDYLTKN